MRRIATILPVSLALVVSCSKEKPETKVSQPVEIPEQILPIEEKQETEVEKEFVAALEVDPVEPAEVKEPSLMEKSLTGQCYYVIDENVIKKNMTKQPKKFILYLTAEWSGICRDNISEIKQIYAEKINPHADIEMLLVSIDTDSSWMKKWARQEKFPWPMIMHDQKSAIGPLRDLDDKTAPLFLLVDQEGREIDVESYTLEACLQTAMATDVE